MVGVIENERLNHENVLLSDGRLTIKNCVLDHCVFYFMDNFSDIVLKNCKLKSFIEFDLSDANMSDDLLYSYCYHNIYKEVKEDEIDYIFIKNRNKYITLRKLFG